MAAFQLPIGRNSVRRCAQHEHFGLWRARVPAGHVQGTPCALSNARATTARYVLCGIITPFLCAVCASGPSWRFTLCTAGPGCGGAHPQKCGSN